uniref:DDE Tnp4 domain-containing protein n=1 Tax=Gadus morhua TaxID=8049 RepID=A0A8C5ARI5_GADMO
MLFGQTLHGTTSCLCSEKKLEEENNNMKLKLSLKETEIERLKAQISTLKKKTLTPELLESSEIPKMLEYSTGFTYDRFNQLCTIFGIPNDPHTTQINVPLNYKRNDWQVAEMPLRSQLLFVLMKLRNNEDLKNLAFRFNITTQTASTIFNSWIHYMFDVLGELPIWPHRDVIAQNMPETYKADYPSTFAILDCTELKIERPTSLVLQSQSFSNYKSTNTLKSLVACDPRGAVIFSSALFTGSMSDKEIVRQCGIIPLLEQLIESGYLQRGDGIMADKGFLIEEEMRAVGLQLNLPPFSRFKRQMPAGDVLVTKRIAKHRVHVERAIGKIKKFKMVSDKIPNTRLGIINHIWYVVILLHDIITALTCYFYSPLWGILSA